MRSRASFAVVLGSGLSGAASPARELEGAPYEEIPGFGRTTVDGHPGRVSLGRVGSGLVLFFAGRFHAYEGLGARAAAAPAFLAAALGCRRLVLTQAAGSLDPQLPPGSWMIPVDVVALPARRARDIEGLAPALRDERTAEPVQAVGAVAGERPVSRASLVSEALRSALREATLEAGVPAADGTLFWTPGPTYETPAEARAASFMGARAASMSSFPELAAARALGMEAAVASWITNFTAPFAPGTIDHADVVRMGEAGSAALEKILLRLVERLGPS